MEPITDGTVPEAFPKAPADPPPAAGRRRNQQLQRIDDYLQASLAHPDPLLANLGALNCQLMRIAHRLLKATDAACAASANPFTDMGALVPAIESCYKVTHQIQRFAEFERKMGQPPERTPFPPRGEKNRSGYPMPWEETPGSASG